MKKTKRSQKIILFLLTCILALNTQTRGFAKNELDNEILTIPIEDNLKLENYNPDDLRVKQLGKIELNRVLTKSEYEKDMKNFVNYYLEWQAYLGNSTREELEKLGEELLKTSDNKTVSDLNLDFAKLIANLLLFYKLLFRFLFKNRVLCHNRIYATTVSLSGSGFLVGSNPETINTTCLAAATE